MWPSCTTSWWNDNTGAHGGCAPLAQRGCWLSLPQGLPQGAALGLWVLMLTTLSHQLSVSQLVASPQGTGQTQQQDGGITHLEANLGSPDAEPCASDQLRALPFTPLQLPMAAVGLQACR